MISISARDKVRSLATGARICPGDKESSKMLAILLREMPEIRAEVKQARHDHLNWVTMTQRDWQRRTHRPSRARHHDSIEIRERYVRC